eukprot:5862935-Heterocapsa_arctica.AAC.1
MQYWDTQNQASYGQFENCYNNSTNKRKGWRHKGTDPRIDRSRENNKKRKIYSLRIGEAENPGPQQQNKQARQRKLGDFFVKNQRHIDSKSEWCKAKGYTIHNIKGDGNCLYTCLGKDM